MKWPEWRCTSGEHVVMGRQKLWKKSGLARTSVPSPNKVIASPLLHHSVVKDHHEGMMPRSLDCS